MKKITLLTSLCVLATVGGVYATWTYAGNANILDAYQEATIGLADVETLTTANGEYSFDSTDLKVSIDQESNLSHKAVLRYDGTITVRFTPAVYAPVAVREGAVPTTLSFSTTVESLTYESKNIFTFTSKLVDGVGTGAYNWKATTTDANGDSYPDYYTFVIDGSNMGDFIAINDFVLDTQAKYNAFNTALQSTKLALDVSDGVAD